MTGAFAVAPEAPGRLGEDVPAPELLAYLDALGRWHDRRRVELDALDEACLRSPERDALTGDILLSMALWQAVGERYAALLEVWDSGRVLEQERRRLTSLVWGRLDSGPPGARAGSPSALGVTLPEACRLSDTLAGSLRARLGLGGSEPDVAARVRDLRAGVERVRDQVALVPDAVAGSARTTLVALDRRLVDVTERARRGADVGGLLGPLELDLATAERDLIVAASSRDRARRDAQDAAARRDDLAARAHGVRDLAGRAVGLVEPAPRFGVPDVTALGDVPTAPAELASFVARLDRVERALAVCAEAYAAALDEHAELARRLAALGARLDVTAGERPDAPAAADPAGRPGGLGGPGGPAAGADDGARSEAGAPGDIGASAEAGDAPPSAPGIATPDDDGGDGDGGDGGDGDPVREDVAPLLRRAGALLALRPVPVPRLRALVAAAEAYLDAPAGPAAPGRPTTSIASTTSVASATTVASEGPTAARRSGAEAI